MEINSTIKKLYKELRGYWKEQFRPNEKPVLQKDRFDADKYKPGQLALDVKQYELHADRAKDVLSSVLSAYVVWKASHGNSKIFKRYRENTPIPDIDNAYGQANHKEHNGVWKDVIKDMKFPETIHQLKDELKKYNLKNIESIDVMIEHIVAAKETLLLNDKLLNSWDANRKEKLFNFTSSPHGCNVFSSDRFEDAVKAYSTKGFNGNKLDHILAPKDLFALAISTNLILKEKDKKAVPGSKEHIEDIFYGGGTISYDEVLKKNGAVDVERTNIIRNRIPDQLIEKLGRPEPLHMTKLEQGFINKFEKDELKTKPHTTLSEHRKRAPVPWLGIAIGKFTHALQKVAGTAKANPNDIYKS